MLNCPTADMRPYTIDGVWEQFGWSSNDVIMDAMLDFWRIAPAGQFFHLRGLEDDFITGPRNVPPRTLIDFDISIWRVTAL